MFNLGINNRMGRNGIPFEHSDSSSYLTRPSYCRYLPSRIGLENPVHQIDQSNIQWVMITNLAIPAGAEFLAGGQTLGKIVGFSSSAAMVELPFPLNRTLLYFPKILQIPNYTWKVDNRRFTFPASVQHVGKGVSQQELAEALIRLETPQKTIFIANEQKIPVRYVIYKEHTETGSKVRAMIAPDEQRIMEMY